jgi:DNA-binding HxlR family transcriptional regulator
MHSFETADDVVRLLASKWTLAVIAKLCECPMRHNKLRKALGDDVSDKALTRVLRRLEAAGVISRRIVVSTPPGVEYCLLPFGHSLVEPLVELASRWHNRRGYLGDATSAGRHSKGLADKFVG